LTDEQIKAQTEIRSKIEKAVASGEINKGSAQKTETPAATTATKETNGKRPATNWSDDDAEEESEEDDSNKKQKSE